MDQGESIDRRHDQSKSCLRGRRGLALGILGLTPADVTVLQVGGSQSRLMALKAGTIDATVLSPEEAMAAQKLGLNPLLDFVAKGVEFPHVNIVAREEYLQ